MRKNFKVVTSDRKSYPDYLWKIILQHMAKVESLNIAVRPGLLKNFLSQPRFSIYYKQCQEELLLAKTKKIPDCWISFYNILVDSKKKLKNYAGNGDLIEDFINNFCMEKFPIYGISMVENFDKGIKRRNLFDKSANLLADCLPIFNPTHLIVRDVLDCVLNKKDLLKFCD